MEVGVEFEAFHSKNLTLSTITYTKIAELPSSLINNTTESKFKLGQSQLLGKKFREPRLTTTRNSMYLTQSIWEFAFRLSFFLYFFYQGRLSSDGKKDLRGLCSEVCGKQS